MIFPAAPTCHARARRFLPDKPIIWDEPRVDSVYAIVEPFRRCSYCGSIHPEDLIKHLEKGAELGGADWKYGWPHKFYVSGIPNVTTALVGKVGSNTKDGQTTDILGKPSPTCWVKWYNEHILDDGFDDEARARLLDLLTTSGITFSLIDGKLNYNAPCYGFQK